jgi:arsenite methyltransferase
MHPFPAVTQTASYQIYAVKSSVTTADSKTIPEPLLHWWDAYPAPTSSPAVMSADDLSSLLLDPSRRDICAVIDVRGKDHAVRMIDSHCIIIRN